MGEGFKYLLKVLLVLNNTDPAMDRVWKRFVGVAVSALLVIAVLTGVWALRWLPTVAMANDLTELEGRMNTKQQTLGDRFDRLALLNVKGAIRNALHDRCAARRAKNQAALDAANSSLDDLTDQFRALAKGQSPDLPNCDVVLIDGAAP